MLRTQSVDAMVAKSEHTPLWIRIWHWTVAVLFVVLVYTGVVLTFSGSQFALMDYELATTLHDVTGISLTVVYVLFLIAAIATGYWRNYVERWRGLFGRINRQGQRVLTWSPRKLSETPIGQRRLETTKPFLLVFQQFLYLISIVVLLPLLILTGIPYLYPETAPATVMSFAGLWPLALSHYVVGLLGIIFLIIHIYIATIAGFWRMIKGR
jgi:thiosulfate reductase cytochrome b subunit